MGTRERDICSCGHDRDVHRYSGVDGPCRQCGCDQFTAGGFLSVTAVRDRAGELRASRWILIAVGVFLVILVAFAIAVTLP